jgi:hypothetical protein
MQQPEKLVELANPVIGSIEDQETIDSVYVSGSLAAGLGTPTSDIDVFVLVPDDVRRDMSTRQVVKDGQRFDIEFRGISAARDSIDLVTTAKTSHADITPLRIGKEDLDFVVRLLYGKTVRDSESLHSLRETLDDRSARLRQFIIAWWALRVGQLFEDLDGALQCRDHDLAGIMGSLIARLTGKAIAAAAGDLYLNEKWVFHQLRRSLGPGFPMDRFRALVRAQWTEDFEAGAQDLMSFIQIGLIAAQTMGWSRAGVKNWPNWQEAAETPRCRRNLIPIRVDDGILLNNERREQFILKPDIALLWGLSHCRTEADYLGSALICGAVDKEYANLTSERCLAARHQLMARDLLV